MADIKEVLVAWAAGMSVSAIGRMLGYTRPTVRKYLTAGQKLRLTRGDAQRTDLEWEALARAVQARLAARRESGTVRAEVAHHYAYLQERVGTLNLSVLHQRLRDEQGLRASWGSFYRYVAAHWPERLRGAQRGASRLTVRLADPAPRLLPAPIPRPERGQQARPIWTGRIRTPAGSGHTELPAAVRQQIAAALAASQRR